MFNSDIYQLFLAVFLVSAHQSLFALAQSQTNTAAGSSPTLISGINPGNSQYKYFGCYNETTGFNNGGNVRALGGGKMFGDDQMTVAKCLSFCAPLQYAGLEYQRECWCAPYLSALSTQLPQEDCNYVCAGNSTEFCGAPLKITLYKVPDKSSGNSGGSSGSSSSGASSSTPSKSDASSAWPPQQLSRAAAVISAAMLVAGLSW